MKASFTALLVVLTNGWVFNPFVLPVQMNSDYLNRSNHFGDFALGGHPNPAIRGHLKSGQWKVSTNLSV